MAKIVSVRRSFWDQLYLPEILRGVGITLRHFFVNTFGSKEIATVRYPEEQRTYPNNFRGLHRLMKREDGSVRCVACFMCSTACPANCIYIEAGERQDGSSVEKYPVRFDIDELVCVACGLCVEACPCDAIRMDSGLHPPAVSHRYEAYQSKFELMKLGSQNIAAQGGSGPNWRKEYQCLEDSHAIYDPNGELNKHLKGS